MTRPFPAFAVIALVLSVAGEASAVAPDGGLRDLRWRSLGAFPVLHCGDRHAGIKPLTIFPVPCRKCPFAGAQSSAGRLSRRGDSHLSGRAKRRVHFVRPSLRGGNLLPRPSPAAAMPSASVLAWRHGHRGRGWCAETVHRVCPDAGATVQMVLPACSRNGRHADCDVAAAKKRGLFINVDGPIISHSGI